MKVQINKLSQNLKDKSCLLNKDLYDELKLDKNELYKIHLGQNSVSCFITPSEKQEKDMDIIDSVLNQLLLLDNVTLNIWRKDNHIYLGPVVGMFLIKRFFKTAENGRPDQTLIEHIMEAGPHANCLSYCFCAENVDLENQRIKGYIYVPKLRKWEYRWFPMPDVVYDRAAYLDETEKEQASEIREQFKNDANIRFINPVGSLGKWPLYKNLSRYPEVRSYLPETVIYKEFEDILAMLNKHNFIFFKSSYGSRGEEVLSVDKIGEKFRIDFFDSGLKVVYAENIEELKTNVEKFIEDKKNGGRKTFIVQQGLRLIKFDGHNMDFRLHIVKNEEGKWFVTNYYANYSKENSKITNYCVGAAIELYEKIYPGLKAMHPEIFIPTQEELGAVTIKMASFIERAFGPHGEIGIDMAIDETGRIWFLEGNAKPDKFRTPGLDDMIGVSPQALAIFKYSIYLTKNRK